MWLSLNSEMEEPVLVELEAPGKRWFTKSGTQTADLTRALNQITEWKAWFGVPRNVEAFKAFYGLNRREWRDRRFRPTYLLIYGRRLEANATPELAAKRGFLHADDIVTMTYDRLRPNPKAAQFICVKSNSKGTFQAISVPPTIEWLPGLAEERALIRDLDVAINSNSHIAEKRKRFLIRRLPYWNEWATKSPHGIINSSDRE